MTTIVYDHKNGLIACDSRLTADDVILTDFGVKWKNSADDSVWFFTGNPADDEKLMMLKPDENPDVKPNCLAIYAKSGNVFLVTFDGDYCTHTKLEYSHAIGSGWKFALSALDFGCNATEAVKHASKRDCYTGGKVSTYIVSNRHFCD